MTRTFIAALVLAMAGAASAQTMYRCGSSYSQQPCPGASEVAGLAPRPAADIAQAKAAAQADAKRADAMEKARLQQEKNAPKATVMGPKEVASAPKVVVAKKKGEKGGKPEEFTAVQPGTVKAKKKS